jgi:hypothetical protein
MHLIDIEEMKIIVSNANSDRDRIFSSTTKTEFLDNNWQSRSQKIYVGEHSSRTHKLGENNSFLYAFKLASIPILQQTSVSHSYAFMCSAVHSLLEAGSISVGETVVNLAVVADEEDIL